MKKILIILSLFLLLSLSAVYANEQNAEEVKQLIDSRTNCDNLTDEQLETIGEYYMEQMHPDEAHELMDQMMGGEGSEKLKIVHTNMAKMLYCNEYMDRMTNSGGSSMMNMMSGGMIGSGKMMQLGGKNMMDSGMMGGAGMLGMSIVGLVYLALAAFVVSVIFWWTYKWVVKSKKK